MSLVSQAIKNLKGGISQQPDILRFADQGAKQVNCFSSEVEGLQKRPPSTHIARLGNANELSVLPLCHTINRDKHEQYAAFFTGTGIRIVDLMTGLWQGVESPNGNGYITTATPREDLRMVTVADYTFIINKKVGPQKGGALTPQYHDPERNALVVCNGGQYAKTFNIWVNGAHSAQFVTPLGNDISHASQIDIGYILQRLKESFDANMSGAGWVCNVMQGYLWIQAPAHDTIRTIKTDDGFNNKLLAGFKRDVQKTDDLPVTAPANYQIRVNGDASTGQDDFWVRFDEDRNVWTEMAAPQVLANYDNASMPHILVRRADGVFEFKQADWTHRAAGDDDTNPYPSFTGEAITDIFFFRNRLGFLAGENVVLSEAGSYFNFFPPSVAVSSDSDPIDVAVSTNKISILKYAVPFAEELLLWADHNQFVLGADGILTPTSVRLDLTTEFEVSDNARPYGIGRGVYFVSPRAKFSAVRRYYAVQDVTQVKNAEDVSAHIPSYIPNGVFKMTGSSTENFLSILTEGAPHHVYMYKFLYLNEESAQQSWSHWDFGAGSRVLCAEMIGAIMHIIIDSPSGIFLEHIEFTQHSTDFVDEPYRLFLDRKMRFVIPDGTYDDDTFKTTIYLRDLYGANPLSGQYICVFGNGVTYTFDPPTGGWPTVDGKIQFDGDLRGQLCFIGESYTMLYEFSKFLIKTTDAAGGTATEDIGRLQLRRAWVNYEKTGNFRIEVENQGRKFTYNMTGNRLGTRDLLIGNSNVDTGQFRYPVSGNAKTITATLLSDTPNPVAIIGGGWEGNYVRRSSGI